MRARCGRCKTEVEGSHTNPKLRRVAKLYGLIWIPIIPILPIMASDYVVSLPLLMIYMLGFGPVYAIVSKRPECNECGAYVIPIESTGIASRLSGSRIDQSTPAGRAGR